MSQPFNTQSEVPALREMDEDKGEFWVGNPFAFSYVNENLSSFERNGSFLNLGDGDFVDMSYLTGTDNPGDARTVIGCDITRDGMPELILRQVGGGPLVVYENRFPKTNWLTVTLRGDKSNHFGIGSRIICETDSGTIQRELFPIVNFLSQAPSRAEFGIGNTEIIKKLTVKWPSGHETILENVDSNRHIRIHEADDSIESFY